MRKLFERNEKKEANSFERTARSDCLKARKCLISDLVKLIISSSTLIDLVSKKPTMANAGDASFSNCLILD